MECQIKEAKPNKMVWHLNVKKKIIKKTIKKFLNFYEMNDKLRQYKLAVMK